MRLHVTYSCSDGEQYVLCMCEGCVCGCGVHVSEILVCVWVG